jgi:hypothetical protein
MRAIDVVERAGHDDRAGIGDDVSNVAAALRGTRHPVHRAGVSAVEPLAEKGELGIAVSGGDTTQIEAEVACLLLDLVGCHVTIG